MGQDQRNTFMFLSHCFTFPQLVFLLGEGHFSSAFPHLLTDAFPCRNNIWDHRLCLLKWFPSCCLPKRTLTFSEWSCSATQNYKSIKNQVPLHLYTLQQNVPLRRKHCFSVTVWIYWLLEALQCMPHILELLISSLMWSGNIKIHLFMSSTKNLNLCYCKLSPICVYVGDEWLVCSCLFLARLNGMILQHNSGCISFF